MIPLKRTCCSFPCAHPMFTIGSSLGCTCSETSAVPLCRQVDGMTEFLNCLNQLVVNLYSVKRHAVFSVLPV